MLSIAPFTHKIFTGKLPVRDHVLIGPFQIYQHIREVVPVTLRFTVQYLQCTYLGSTG